MTKEIIKEAWQTEINPKTLVKKNGNYTNIHLNSYKGSPGMNAGEFITVKKDDEYNGPFSQERDGQYGKYFMHSCKVIVDGEKATFVTFNDNEAQAFEDVAGLEDTIQISKEKYTYVDGRGTERVKEELKFRKVE